MTTAVQEMVPYGLREVELHHRDWHPADDCHIDPVSQLIVDADGKPLSLSLEMSTAVCTSKSQKHHQTEEWGADDW